ncbi:MAG: reverse transcriptase family protein [Flavobacteriales bacterium]
MDQYLGPPSAPMRPLMQLSALADSLRLSYDAFLHELRFPSYHTFYVSKKDGSRRRIDAPMGETKRIQKRFARNFQDFYGFMASPIAHGFISDNVVTRSYGDIYTNARVHAGKKYVWNTDIASFFPSITARMVREALLNYGYTYSEDVAHAIALFCCRNGCLPQGSPASPALSNMVCRHMDQELYELAQLNNISITRYADDITCSSNDGIPHAFKDGLRAVLRSYGFTVQGRKERLQGRGQRQMVTGLVVNEKPNVDRRTIRELRAVLYDWERNGLAAAAAKYKRLPMDAPQPEAFFLYSLLARIGFVRYIRGKEDAIGLRMMEKWRGLVQRDTMAGSDMEGRNFG